MCACICEQMFVEWTTRTENEPTIDKTDQKKKISKNTSSMLTFAFIKSIAFYCIVFVYVLVHYNDWHKLWIYILISKSNFCIYDQVQQCKVLRNFISEKKKVHSAFVEKKKLLRCTCFVDTRFQTNEKEMVNETSFSTKLEINA